MKVFVVVLAVCALASPLSALVLSSELINEWETIPAWSGDPSALTLTSMATANSNGVLFGGYSTSDSALRAQTFVYDFSLASPTWRFVVGGIAPPSARASAAITTWSERTSLNPLQFEERILLFGGCTAYTVAGGCTAAAHDFFVFNTDNFQWGTIALTTGVTPAGRAGASFVSYRGGDVYYALLYGGQIFDGSSTLPTDTTVYEFYGDEMIFRASPPANPSTAPVARAYHSATMIEGVMWVYGGVSGTTVFNDVWTFVPGTSVWTLVTTTGGPSVGRFGAAAFGLDINADLGGLLVLGGRTTVSSGVQSTSWALDVKASPPAWTALASVPAAVSHAGVLDDGGNPVLFGGFNSANVAVDSFYRYYTRPSVETLEGFRGLSGTEPATSGTNCGQDRVVLSGSQFAAPGQQMWCLFGSVVSTGTVGADNKLTCVTPQHEVGVAHVSVGVNSEMFSRVNPTQNWVFVEGVTDATMTIPVGIPGRTIAGTTGTFSIQARTSCGTDRTFGGDTFTLELSLNGVVQASGTYSPVIVDNLDGSYTVTFQTTLAGDYSMRILLSSGPSSTAIGGGSYELVVVANDVYGPTYVTGLVDSFRAGLALTPFTIEAVDQWNNVIYDSALFTVVARLDSDPVGTQVTGILETHPAPTRPTASFTTTRAGEWTVSIYYGTNTTVTPLKTETVFVEPAEYNAASCTATGFAVESGTVGIPGVMTIEPRDVYGNVAPTPDLDFVLLLEGNEHDYVGTVTVDPDKPDGSAYLAVYTATRTGYYAASVKLDGTHIRGSPFSIAMNLGDTVSIAGCYAYGGLFDDDVIRAGDNVGFTIQARDDFGNNVGETGAGLDFVVEGGAVRRYEVIDYEEGSYLVTFKLKHFGHFNEQQISVSADGIQISGSPFTIDVQYGGALFALLFFVVLFGAIILAVVITWALRRIQRKLRYERNMKKPEKIFPGPTLGIDFQDDPDWNSPDTAFLGINGGVAMDDINTDWTHEGGTIDSLRQT